MAHLLEVLLLLLFLRGTQLCWFCWARVIMPRPCQALSSFPRHSFGSLCPCLRKGVWNTVNQDLHHLRLITKLREATVILFALQGLGGKAGRASNNETAENLAAKQQCSVSHSKNPPHAFSTLRCPSGVLSRESHQCEVLAKTLSLWKAIGWTCKIWQHFQSHHCYLFVICLFWGRSVIVSGTTMTAACSYFDKPNETLGTRKTQYKFPSITTIDGTSKGGHTSQAASVKRLG